MFQIFVGKFGVEVVKAFQGLLNAIKKLRKYIQNKWQILFFVLFLSCTPVVYGHFLYLKLSHIVNHFLRLLLG
jgi:hypothetical protein